MNNQNITISLTTKKGLNLIFFILLSFLIFSCSDVNQNHIGESGYSCYEDNSCDDSLVCIEGKICTDLCKNFECLNGKCIIDNQLPVCICEDNYLLDNNSCIFDCSKIKNSHINEINDGCECNPNYKMINNECLFDCSQYSHPNISNNGCECNENYLDMEDKCIYDCSNVENSHINDTNDSCECDESYTMINSNCIFDCSILENSHLNDTNDGCECDDLYILNENICLFDCSNIRNSHVNDTNDGCSCDENYQDNDNDSICLINCSYALDSGILSCPISCDDRDGSIGCSCDDPITRENINNNPDSAYFVPLGENTSFVRENLTTGLSSCDYTDDWYKIHLEPWSRLYVKINFIHSDGNLDLELLDNDLNSLTIRHSSTSGDTVVNYEYFTYHTEGEAKDFYIKVYNAYNIYKLTISSALSYETYTYDDHEYRFFDIDKEWEDAKIICESFNYHLVTITNINENDFISDIIHSRYWIGLFREDTDFPWQWVTEEELLYSNLDDNSWRGDNCVYMDYRNNWRAEKCTRDFNFICEEVIRE